MRLALEQSFCNFDEELILIIHLLDDLNEVGNELISDPVVTCING